MVKYAPFKGRGWQPLPEFLAKQEAIINIWNNDERCFRCALFYFLERVNLFNKNGNSYRASVYKEKMFQQHYFDTLLYPISPNDVHLYEYQIQININILSYFDDENRACHPLVKNRKNYQRMANLLYWKEDYAPITNITRLFSDITNHDHEYQICLRCLGHFQTEESFARHKQLCTENEFMSVLNVLNTPGSKQAQLKFINYKFGNIAPFVIYAEFKSIIEPLSR